MLETATVVINIIILINIINKLITKEIKILYQNVYFQAWVVLNEMRDYKQLVLFRNKPFTETAVYV